MKRHVGVFNTNFLTSARTKVHKLKDLWEQRAENTPFYTLGAASYIDATPWKGGFENYWKKASAKNVQLLSNFPAIYQQLFDNLETILGARIAMTHALPGFHIFGACREFMEPVASIHMDRQFGSLKWPGRVDRVFSFTIPIEIPSGGSGLKHWEQVGFSEETEHFTEYKLGDIICHFGQIKHQIAPFKEVIPGEWRITLQGHGVLIDGVWYIYW